MNLIVFSALSLLLLAAAFGVLLIGDQIRCALAAALTFVGLGLFFIALGVEFLGLVQLLVYVGAVAILIVFVLLLTRQHAVKMKRFGPTAYGGMITAAILLVGIWLAIWHSPSLNVEITAEPEPDMIATIGERLLSTHLLPLQTVAVLLTAAMIGAALFVWDDFRPRNPPKSGGTES